MSQPNLPTEDPICTCRCHHPLSSTWACYDCEQSHALMQVQSPSLDELRQEISNLKPHSEEQLPLGDLLSKRELDGIMQLFTSYLERTRDDRN
jgi:hypothetical protein